MPLIHNPRFAIGRTARFRALKSVAVDTQNLQTKIDLAESEVTIFTNDAMQAKQAVDALPVSIQGIQKSIAGVENQVTSINSIAENAKKTVDTLSNSIVSLEAKVITTNGTIDSLYKSSELAEAIVERVLAQSTDVLNMLIKVRKKLDDSVPGFGFPDDFPESRLDDLWICERTLHRVEQLVTDEKPTDAKIDNNKQLKHIQSDSLTTKCREILTSVSANDLADEVEHIHYPFKNVKNSITEERYERFIQIQQLRQKIVACLLKVEKKQEPVIQ